jgi:hypothetical protein
MKLIFIIIEVILAIAFGSCNFKKAYNAAAVLEWAIAFIFTFYVFSFFIDLIPAVRTKLGKGAMGGQTELEQQLGGGRNTAESERTLGENNLPATVPKPGRDESGNPVMASNF